MKSKINKLWFVMPILVAVVALALSMNAFVFAATGDPLSNELSASIEASGTGSEIALTWEATLPSSMTVGTEYTINVVASSTLGVDLPAKWKITNLSHLTIESTSDIKDATDVTIPSTGQIYSLVVKPTTPGTATITIQLVEQ